MEKIIQYLDTYGKDIATWIYMLSILLLLYRIGTAILDQTAYLKGEDTIDEIGSND